jgi:hypothetical protein
LLDQFSRSVTVAQVPAGPVTTEAPPREIPKLRDAGPLFR